MTKSEFRKVLERFRSEINALEEVDVQVRERVNVLITDLEQQVEDLRRCPTQAHRAGSPYRAHGTI